MGLAAGDMIDLGSRRLIWAMLATHGAERAAILLEGGRPVPGAMSASARWRPAT